MKIDKFEKKIFGIVLSVAMICSQFSSSLIFISALEENSVNSETECICQTETEVHEIDCPDYIVETTEISDEESGDSVSSNQLNTENVENVEQQIDVLNNTEETVDESEPDNEINEIVEEVISSNVADSLDDLTDIEVINLNATLVEWKSRRESADVTITVNDVQYVVNDDNYDEFYQFIYDELVTRAEIWPDTYVKESDDPVQMQISNTVIYKLNGNEHFLNAFLEIGENVTVVLINESDKTSTLNFQKHGKFIVDGGNLVVLGRNNENPIVFDGMGDYKINGYTVTSVKAKENTNSGKSDAARRKSNENLLQLFSGGVFLEYLTIKNHVSQNGSTSTTGGAIHVKSSDKLAKLYASDVLFEKCLAKGGGAFGSASLGKDSEVFFYKTSFNECVARGGSNNSGGGAIRAGAGSGKFTFTECIFEGNLAVAGDKEGSGYNGGGAVRWNLGEEYKPNGIFRRCLFKGNKANGRGGAIIGFGGFSLLECELTENVATVSGGAMFVASSTQVTEAAVLDKSGSIVLGSGTNIHDNKVEFNPNSNSQSGGKGYGGAIHFLIGPSKLGDNGVRENYDLELFVRGAVIHSNEAIYGGAIGVSVNYNYNCGVYIEEGSEIYNNSADLYEGNGGDGGAIYINADKLHQKNHGMMMSGGTVRDNKASGDGGAVYLNIGSMNMSGGTVCGNEALGNGGAAYINQGDFTITGGYLGEVDYPNKAVLGGGAYITDGNFTLNGESAVICGNKAINGAGIYLTGGEPFLYEGTIQNNIASNLGGGIFIDQQEVVMRPTNEVNIVENSAVDGAGIYINGTETVQASFSVDPESAGNVLISQNVARGQGAAVCIHQGLFNLNADRVTLKDNEANHGGAVAVLSGKFLMSDGLIENCTAQLNGGAVYMNDTNSIAEMSGGTITDCDAQNGGAVYMEAGVFAISNQSLIENCAATETGGAVYLGGGLLNVNGGNIYSNTAENGAGVYLRNGTMKVTGGKIQENTANNNGGGALLNGGEVIVTGGEVTGNIATNNGGGIAVNDGNYTMVGGTVTNNSATNASGGGVYVTATNDVDLNVMIYSGEISNNYAKTSGGAMSVFGVADGTARINVQFGVNEKHFEALDKPINCDHDIGDHTDEIVLLCPQIHNNVTGINGGAVYVTGNQNTFLKMFCLQESGNTVTDDDLSWFMKVEGGQVLLSTLQPDEVGSYENSDYNSPFFGNIDIDNTIHTTGGIMDLWGQMTNPSISEVMTIDLTKDGDAFRDHRIDTTHIKMHYYENFKDTTGVVTGQYKAYDVQVGSDVTISGNIYEHPGYTIRGWNTKDDATGEWYYVGSTHEINESLIIYAIWGANGYKVYFDSNVPDNTLIEGNMPEYQLHTYDVNQKLVENAWLFPGYHFVGWNTAKDGSGESYGNGELVVNLTKEDQITLYAQWEKCTHSKALNEYTYSLINEGMTIKAVCECRGYSETATVIVENKTYNRLEQPAFIRYTPDINGTDNYVLKDLEITYKSVISETETLPLLSIPKNAGDYVASIFSNEITASVAYTINKAPQDIHVETIVDQVETEDGKTQLRVHSIESSPLSIEGTDLYDSTYDSTRQYQLVYFTGDERIESEWMDDLNRVFKNDDNEVINIGFVFDLEVALTNYFVYARYSEGTNYLASKSVSAIKPYFYEGVTVYPHFGEGVIPDIVFTGQESDSNGNGFTLTVALENDTYYFPHDYMVTQITIVNGVESDETKFVENESDKQEKSYSFTNIPANSEVHVYIPSAKKDVTMNSLVTENQVFDTVTSNSATISRDSAFTAYFEVNNYLKDEYENMTLSFEPGLPQGTTIVAKSIQGDQQVYYWHETSSDSTDIVDLDSFIQMGSSIKYEAVDGNLELQFVVDFSKVSNDKLLTKSQLEITLTAEPKDRDDEEVAVGPKSAKSSVFVILEDESVFGMDFNNEVAITRQIYVDYTQSNGVASKWDKRNMALILRPLTSIPSDAYMIFSYSQYTIVSHSNNEGYFVVPLSTLSDKTISATLVSNAFPTESTPYEFDVDWVVSNSLASNAALNGEVVRSKKIVFKTLTVNLPSIKVNCDKQLYGPDGEMTINVDFKHVDSSYTAKVVLMRKTDSGVYTNTGWSKDLLLSDLEMQTIENVSINLAGQVPGSFALQISITKNTDKIVEAYFYFIIENH